MDIDRVRYFHVFTEAGSLVKASQILHISQPALSKALRRLESEIGAKLLMPEGRGLRLTEAGRTFKHQTESLLNEWLNIPTKLKGIPVYSPTKIGSFEVFTTYFLGQLMGYVELEKLEVHELEPGHLEQAIADRVVDIGITYSPVPKAGIEFTEVTKIRMGVFGASAFKRANFSSLPFTVPLHSAGGTPSKVMGLDGWPDHRYQRQIKFRVSLMESAMELCRKGHSVAYLPEFVVKLHNENTKSEFKLIEYDSPISKKDSLQSVFLVKRQQESESKLERQIAKCLRSC